MKLSTFMAIAAVLALGFGLAFILVLGTSGRVVPRYGRLEIVRSWET
jgi:hypothetical protein